MPDLSNVPDWAELTLRVLLIAVVAAVAVFLLRQAVRVGVRGLVERRAETDAEKVPPVELERRVNTIARLIVKVGGTVIVVIAVLMALSEFGVDVGPAIAGLGVAGIAVGFGAQTLIRDWLAGIFIVLENQYNEGDVVRIAGVDGVVEDLSLRRTTLRDLDGTVHTVPNGAIVVASNLTRLWARVNLDVAVAYDTDIDAATAVINQVGEELHADPEWGPRMLEPPKVVRVAGVGDSQVTLKVLGQVKPAEQWAVAGELRKRILAAFSKAGIKIPFPHRVVVRQGSGAGADADAEADAAAAAVDDEPTGAG